MASSLANRLLGGHLVRNAVPRLSARLLSTRPNHAGPASGTTRGRYGRAAWGAAAALGAAGVAGLVSPAAVALLEQSKEETHVDSLPIAGVAPEVFPAKEPAPMQPERRRRDKFKYIIVGTGTAGYGALKAIQKNDPSARVLMISNEKHVPYSRPPLSKELWFSEDPKVTDNLKFTDWEGKDASIDYEVPEKYTGNVELILGNGVEKIDLETKMLRTADGSLFRYEKMLLATGGKPRELDIEISSTAERHVTSFRGVADFQRLHSLVEQGQDVLIVGGGFLGSELACAISAKAKKYGAKVTLACPEPGVLHKHLPRFLSDLVTTKLRRAGVNVQTSTVLSSVKTKENDAGTAVVELKSHSDYSVETGHVVLAAGLEPNTELAEDCGLELDEKNGGVLVNADLEARSNVYVAGDLASYYEIGVGRRRVEHYDHALSSGFRAGENMVAKEVKPYRHQSMFWSDLVGLDISYECVGIIDSSLDTVGFYKMERKEVTISEDIPSYTKNECSSAVVCYMRGGKVVGMMLWNLPDQVDKAKIVLRLGKKYDSIKDLKQLPTVASLGLDEVNVTVN